MMEKARRERKEEGRGKTEEANVDVKVKIFFILSFVLFFASSFLLLPSSFVNASSNIPTDFPKQVCFQSQCLAVEVADSDDERMRGLQYRTSLGENQGMLFVFPDEDQHYFWMKDTYISLDMIWLDQNYKIVHIQSDVQPCKADPCPQYGPSVNSLYVLEANAGYAKQLGLKIGDKAIFK